MDALRAEDMVITEPEVVLAPFVLEWTWLLTGRVRPLFFSKFGDLLFQRTDGHIYFLDVLEGDLLEIATTEAAFRALIAQPTPRDAYLRAGLAQEARRRGFIEGHGECFAFAPHPLMTGGLISRERAMVMPLGAWNRICSGMLKIASGE